MAGRPQPHQGDRVSDDLRQQNEHDARQSRLAPIVEGKQIDGVEFDGGTELEVYHNLGHVPTGYFQVGSTVATALSDSERDTKKILLTASQTATVSIWIY